MRGQKVAYHHQKSENLANPSHTDIKLNIIRETNSKIKGWVRQKNGLWYNNRIYRQTHKVNGLKPLTYISLFSSAGVGCYGFKQAGFDCVLTNEIIPRRLDVQKHNQKCSLPQGYLCGDISDRETQSRALDIINDYKNTYSICDIDVIIATPPCQGMSVANHKKSVHEIVRNSLVIEAIRLIKHIKP